MLAAFAPSVAPLVPNRIGLPIMVRRSRSSQRALPLDELAGRPDFSAERKMAGLYGLPIAGIDEAGRGPWAGPVVAAAVVFDLDRPALDGLNDSKQVAETAREALYDRITAEALAFGIGMASPAEIDDMNIRQATHLAMARALAALESGSSVIPAAIIVDGDDAPALARPTRPIVRGDARSLSIAAASILAKVTRDRLMVALDREHPGYGFARHKGYGTAQHGQALAALGPCPIHRRSFAPVAAMLG